MKLVENVTQANWRGIDALMREYPNLLTTDHGEEENRVWQEYLGNFRGADDGHHGLLREIENQPADRDLKKLLRVARIRNRAARLWGWYDSCHRPGSYMYGPIQRKLKRGRRLFAQADRIMEVRSIRFREKYHGN